MNVEPEMQGSIILLMLKELNIIFIINIYLPFWDKVSI